MNKYKIIIYRSNVDNVFIAEIPGLKSFTAHGESHNKTLREVSVVANEWITIARENGWEIPQPKGRLIYA